MLLMQDLGVSRKRQGFLQSAVDANSGAVPPEGVNESGAVCRFCS